ncbi:DUF3006 domain-containing protein [Candidatus Woesearchaeota archaeon]|nr:DUF3006 domain-containing protein [Candidatus Woesearchaeota archaeon]
MKKWIYLGLLASLCSCTNNIEGHIEYLISNSAFVEVNNNLEILNLNEFKYYPGIKEGDYIIINPDNISYNKEKTETLKEEIKQIQSRLRH